MKKRCFIAGAGEFCGNALPGNGDYVIAADGGYAALASRGITPDLIIGDFDSLAPDLLGAVSDHPNVIRSSAEKDDTDMMLAVRYGLEQGYETFVINGGLGGRLDQTLANIQILVYIADSGARGTLFGHEVGVTVIKNGELRFSRDETGCEGEAGGKGEAGCGDETGCGGEAGCGDEAGCGSEAGGGGEVGRRGEAGCGAVSVFSARDKAEGVTLKGLKYPLDNATLTNDYPLGVSNEFTGVPAVISVCEGTLIVIWDRRSEDK